jgi:hypothetical protein
MHKSEVASHIYDLDANFFNDVAAGNLPDFAYLQPRCSCPSPDKPPTW